MLNYVKIIICYNNIVYIRINNNEYLFMEKYSLKDVIGFALYMVRKYSDKSLSENHFINAFYYYKQMKKNKENGKK